MEVLLFLLKLDLEYFFKFFGFTSFSLVKRTSEFFVSFKLFDAIFCVGVAYGCLGFSIFTGLRKRVNINLAPLRNRGN
jgi:hypothetical protein